MDPCTKLWENGGWGMEMTMTMRRCYKSSLLSCWASWEAAKLGKSGERGD